MSNESSPKLFVSRPSNWAVKAAEKVWDKFVGTKPYAPIDVIPTAEIIEHCFNQDHIAVLTGSLEMMSDSRFFAGLAMQSILQMGGVDALENLANSTPEEFHKKISDLAKLACGIAEIMEAQQKSPIDRAKENSEP